MSDYGYANARLRALRSRLLDRRALVEMASLGRLEDVIARLAQTPYADAIQEALGRYTGVRVVMEAARLHLAHSLRRVRSFYGPDAVHLVDALLARWDLANLKTLLRGQAAHARPEDTLAALTPAGVLGDAALRLLARQPDPAALGDSLRLWNVTYAQAVRSALTTTRAGHEGLGLEVALDREFYARILAGLGAGENDALVRAALAHDIDAANIMTALRLRRAGAPAETATPWFLPGGSLPIDSLLALTLASRDDEALALLRATRFGPPLASLESLDLIRLQRLLDGVRVRFGVAFFSRDPLTIAPAIGYIAAQSAETTNVRLVGQGVALGLPATDIERDLLGV